MSRSATFPDPLVIPPLSGVHKQTIILLHGRGSSAAKFGPSLLSAIIPLRGASSTASLPTPPATTTLPACFPHARFVFPTAQRSRATCYRRSRINQWFDDWHVNEDSDAQPWLQVEGLRQTVSYLHGLIRAEAQEAGGLKNVVLGGLSQGCAASLVAALLLDGEEEGERLGASIGMCGYLPFRQVVGKAGSDSGGDSDDDDEDLFDPFERSADDDSSSDHRSAEAEDGTPESADGRNDPLEKAILSLREELEMPRPTSAYEVSPVASTPIFMGHGTEDDRVPLWLGRESANRLSSTGIKVSWHEYPGLGHWYSEDMLADLVDFVKAQTGGYEDMDS